EGAELHRLPFALDVIAGEVEDHEVDVPVPVGHAVLPGRAGLGVLGGIPDEVAGDAVLVPAALADAGGGHLLHLRQSLATGPPQYVADAAVAALQGGGDALGKA